MGSPSSEEILRRVSYGDLSALVTLYERHAGEVLSLAQWILGERRAADAVVEQIFLQVWQGATFDADACTASAWLLTLTRERAIEERRRLGEARPQCGRASSTFPVFPPTRGG
jgi:RNA polymerase sigma-70 factor (ECF subfamily)